MSTVKYPIVWRQDIAGNFSVATMGGIAGVSVDADLNKAKLALEKYLIWAHKQEPWADLSNLQTGRLDVSLRGQLQSRNEQEANERWVFKRYDARSETVVFAQTGRRLISVARPQVNEANRAGQVQTSLSDGVEPDAERKRPEEPRRSDSCPIRLC